MATNYSAVGYETLTVSDTAGSLVGATTARSFVGYLETAQIRMRGDGTAPTSSEGVIVDVADKIILSESEIGRMQFIRTGSTSGVIKGHFMSVEASVLIGGQ